MTTNFLDIKNLHIEFKTYAGTIQAVKGLNISIKKGEIVGLVGESGCGKSVTAHSIMGLLKKEAKITGEINFKNLDLLKLNEAEKRKMRGKHIGMIFQDPFLALNPTMKIGTQISEGMRKHLHLSSSEAHEKTLHFLKVVGIGDPLRRIEQYPHELSGGMRQRILIAMALACEPELLIADEPTTALDVTIQAQILELLKELKSKINLTLLLITHDWGVVANLCDRVLVMHQGEIIEDNNVFDIFTHPQHPYTKTLLRSKQSLHSL